MFAFGGKSDKILLILTTSNLPGRLAFAALLVKECFQDNNLNTLKIRAKVKYYAKENTKLGTHSFYAVPVPNGTLTFNELCEEACRNTSIEPSIMKAAVSEYMKTVQLNVLKGFRVPVGEQFITVYPNLNVSVKDTKNQDGTVKEVATAKMVTANKGKSRLGASVSIKFSQEFASQVSWQKIDERTGAEIPEEDITDGADDNTGGGGTTPPSGELEG